MEVFLNPSKKQNNIERLVFLGLGLGRKGPNSGDWGIGLDLQRYGAELNRGREISNQIGHDTFNRKRIDTSSTEVVVVEIVMGPARSGTGLFLATIRLFADADTESLRGFGVVCVVWCVR